MVIHTLKLNTNQAQKYLDALKYVHAVKDYKGGTLLTRQLFSTVFLFIYFNLENQKADI
mgnify:CR=1 FL=1